MTYFISHHPTPIFNRDDIYEVFGLREGGYLQVDKEGHLRALEMIAFPNTVFKVCGQCDGNTIEVNSKVYRSTYPLFVDGRFGKVVKRKPQERSCQHLGREAILKRLHSALGTPYFWGGNVRKGLPFLLTCYTPSRELTPFEKTQWMFCGVDCSGLIYEATDGLTPRNTLELLFYGSAVPIEGLENREIARLLRPLDLIVYRGHVIIVFTEGQTIESQYEAGGVVLVPLKERLQRLIEIEGKTPVNNPQKAQIDSSRYVIRRIDRF